MTDSQPARVLHVVKSLGIGGTEKAAQLLAVHLDRSRFTPFVYSSADGERREQLKAAGIPVIAGGDLFTALERLKPDLVHIHRAGWPEPELLRPVKRFGPRAVVETNVFGRFDDTPLGALIDMHLFVSHFCLDRLVEHLGPRLDLTRCRVLYNPVDTDLFRRLASDRDFSRPLAARLSRPDPGKWSRLAFDSLPILKKLEPGFILRVIGATPEFEAFVRDQGLAGNVEILPPVALDQDLAAFFGQATLLAHSNDTGESFGMAIAEAMASGLPVVTHRASGERDNAQLELVEHGVTGLVADTAEDYAQAMAWLWRNPDAARRMGEAGREKAARLYRVQVVTRQLEEIYSRLLGLS
ncbi:glycosyltransferase family 4 protein [Fundidesulfovibrio terrae]|uniref:glycosyltransferase family 4 protein n=1 Tax=Fundidesulfovibrio terrae TaxID=2922866 RepID=UPI001FAF967A|nr:glycosyltransferase family 4 protein [Fundidesulfovibrio terrae]